MINKLSEIILSNWSNYFPADSKPEKLEYICLPGSIEGGTTTFLFFGNKATPCFAAKISRHKKIEQKFINEFKVLSKLQANKFLKKTIPHIVFHSTIDNVDVIIETIVQGTSMGITLSQGGTPDLDEFNKNCLLITSWLSQLSEIKTDFQDIDHQKKLILNYFDTLFHFFEFSSKETEYLSNLKAFFLCQYKYRQTIEHGDFCRHNILINHKNMEYSLSILDWTDSSEEGFPLQDLFFFLATYFIQVRKETGASGFFSSFEDTFLSNTPYGNTVQQTIRSFAKAHNIDQTDLEPLFALFLIKRCLFEANMVNNCLLNKAFPRLNIFMAQELGLNYKERLKAQYWVNYLKIFIRNKYTK